MKIAIGADSAGKPLLDVIAKHLAGKSELSVSDLAGKVFMPTPPQLSASRSLTANSSVASFFAARASASASRPIRCPVSAPLWPTTHTPRNARPNRTMHKSSPWAHVLSARSLQRPSSTLGLHRNSIQKGLRPAMSTRLTASMLPRPS